ncbi:hypothetical protein [Streptomyces sp. NBC_01236]|uniref:hypothetical protein n=1 Tax=Streptomyces sp. NBC_01236 TaxID=2903789 RepID=UPI002E11F7A6|nr:hypothetical protein OG324_40460 [Streptomyces sp. NBC_01236]
MQVPVQAAQLAHDASGSGLVGAGIALVAAATLAGVWLARRGSAQRAVWLAAASAALLTIAAVHLLPDAWLAAPAAGLARWAVPSAALASFGLSGLVARKGCPCAPDTAAGIGTAAALGAHRFLEGTALALSGSPVVAGALAVHALAEGLAVGALLHAEPRRRMALWSSVLCLGPAAGALAVGLLPEHVEPLLVALAAGVLVQAAWVSLKAAAHLGPHGWRLGPRPAAAALCASALVVLAVLVAG